MNRLGRLLRPKSIAVFGKEYAQILVRYMSAVGYAGDIWPVHPEKDEVAGLRAYRSVTDLPGVPDAAFVAVNRHLTIEVVRALAERGAGGALCYAAGFRETAFHDQVGERLQAELVAVAGDMPIIGPNCNGMVNYADGVLLWADNHGGMRLAPGARGVGIVTQSGSIGANLTSQRRGLPLAFLVTAGNQAQTGLSEI
ncbi:CoA-binding protein, partial [Mesorhizobium sp. M0622]|uniref:CoA-binding protein n=1 Tax=Mesorhizobium sp. M0622 TaxID=2956975 RepID=UPI0033380447